MFSEQIKLFNKRRNNRKPRPKVGRWEAPAAFQVTPSKTQRNNRTEATAMNLQHLPSYFFPKFEREVP